MMRVLWIVSLAMWAVVVVLSVIDGEVDFEGITIFLLCLLLAVQSDNN